MKSAENVEDKNRKSKLKIRGDDSKLKQGETSSGRRDESNMTAS
jgi:hypothetical protein